MSNASTSAIRFHRFARSGHCHRVEWLLSALELPHEVRDVDLAAGEHRTAAFLKLNPFGQVPVLEDGEVALGDSNAILMYLAAAYGEGKWLPKEPARLAALQRWLSVAAGPLAYGPAQARAHRLFRKPVDIEAVQASAHALLRQINTHLEQQPFLLGAELSLADIANYAYIAHAPEGGVGLEEYAAIREWIARLEGVRGFVPMPRS